MNKNKFICIFDNHEKINKNDFIVCIDFNDYLIKNKLKNKYRYFNKGYCENDMVFNLNLDKCKVNKKLQKNYCELLRGLKNNKQ